MTARDPLGLSHVTRPGRAPERRENPPHVSSIDTPDQIARCRSCPYPDCKNCLAHSGGVTHAQRRADFLRLYRSGLTDSAIAKLMGVTTSAVAQRRLTQGLPPNKPPKGSAAP